MIDLLAPNIFISLTRAHNITYHLHPLSDTMCAPAPSLKSKNNDASLKAAIVFFSFTTLGLLIVTISLATSGKNTSTTASETAAATAADYSSSKTYSAFFASDDANVCEGAKLAFDNQLCADLEVPGPQAGGNVTKGAFTLKIFRVKPLRSRSWGSYTECFAPSTQHFRVCWKHDCRCCSKYQTLLSKLHVSSKLHLRCMLCRFA